MSSLKKTNKMDTLIFQPIKEIKVAVGAQAAYDTAVLLEPGFLWIVPDEYKTEGMCSSVVRRKLCTLVFVPDHFKTQKMCDKAVKNDPSLFQLVPDWFVTQQQIDIWHDNDDFCNDNSDYWDDSKDKVFELYNRYKKCKAQKAQIKKELLPTAWHTTRWWDWCQKTKKRD